MSDVPPLPAVLPLRGWDVSKQRLAGALSAARLARLAQAMAEDVLDALRGCACIGEMIVVSDDPAVAAVAGRYGAQTWPDAGSLNAAAATAARRLARAGAREMLIVHGDLPLLCARELSALVRVHRRERHALTVAPDRFCQGSNVLLISPPDAMSFHYGAGSCRRHLAAARESGRAAGTLFLPGCALDIDTAADLALLRQRAGPACRAGYV